MRKRKWIIMLVTSLLVLFLSYSAVQATSVMAVHDSEPHITSDLGGVSAKQAEGPANTVYLEIRIHPETHKISAAGVSADNLTTAVGILPLNKQVVDLLNETGTLRLSIRGEKIDLISVDGTTLATINWDTESRESLMTLAAASGVPVTEDSQSLVESMLASSDVDIVLMVKPGLAKAATLNLITLIPANLNSKGKLSVLGVDTPLDIGPALTKRITDAEIESVSACYNQGTIELSANDSKLPSVTIHPAGFELFDTALGNTLGLTLGDQEAYKPQRVGIVVVMPDGVLPENTTCGVATED